MTRSRLTALAVIIGVIIGLLLLDWIIAAALGKVGNLDAGQIAWRVVPVIVGGSALVVIALRLRRLK